MEWISLIANIAQIVSVIWLLFIGSDTIWTYLNKRTSKLNTSGKIGFLVALAALVVSTFIWFAVQHSSKLVVDPTPSATSIPSPTSIPTPTIAGTHMGTIEQLATNGTYVPYSLQLSFQQDGGNISGSCQIGNYLSGSFNGTVSTNGDIAFICNTPAGNAGSDTFDFKGKIASDGSLSGDCKEYNPGQVYISDSSWNTN